MRIPREGGGKSGGFRFAYVFADTNAPLFLLTVFAKNEKANLKPKEKATLVAASKKLVENWRERHERI